MAALIGPAALRGLIAAKAGGRLRAAGRPWILASLLVLLALLALAAAGSDRSFLLEARTNGLSIRFDSAGTAWRLPATQRCVPVEIPDPSRTGPCGPAAAPDGAASEWAVAWPEGTQVDLTRRPEGALEVRVVSGGGAGDPAGTVFVLPARAWPEAGALAFSGAVTLGDDMRTGLRRYLLAGRWEAREAGPVTSLLRGVTEVVKTGELATGAKVSVLRGDAPARVYGYVTPGPDALAVTMISEAGDTALSVWHYGLEAPVVLRPDWVDVAVSSPLLIAVATIFTILVSLGQVLTTAGRPAGPRET